ncbi:hypothetical protein AB0I16_17240 [Streptomyces sp. NPDC050703]|uniref:hypothetical protein n=1 Tax=Streptomyces sp. NPDC050703 TaxID=3157218 RepID=UPI003445B76D
MHSLGGVRLAPRWSVPGSRKVNKLVAHTLQSGAGGTVSGDTACRVGVLVEGVQDGDRDELDDLVRQLRERLLELDVDSVELLRGGTPPAGAKSGDLVSLGALTITMAPFVLRSVVRLVEQWIEHRPVRTVSLTIGDDSLELQVVSSADQRRLIDAFVAGHESPPLTARTDRRPLSDSAADEST